MSEHLGAASYERAEGSTGRRNGHKPRTSRFRVPTLNLLVPRTGREPSPPGSSPVTRGMIPFRAIDVTMFVPPQPTKSIR
jgi:hypothetical protein